MPCYITYRIRESIAAKEFDAVLTTAKALNMRVQRNADGSGATIGSITAVKQGDRYELSSTDGSAIRNLLQEHNVKKVERDARNRGYKTKRTVNGQGKLELRIVG